MNRAPLFPILPRAESAHTFEAIVDPYTRDVLGHHLLVPGASAARTFDLASTWLARRVPHAATPLFMGVSVSDAELCASSLGRGARELRRRGVNPSELRVVLHVGTELTGLTALFDAAQRAGVGCVVAATTTATIALANVVPRGTVLAPTLGALARALPVERAELVRLLKLAHRRGAPVWLRQIDTFADLKLSACLGAHWVSGRITGGARHEHVRALALLEPVLRLSNVHMARYDDHALLEAGEREAVGLVHSINADPDTRDLAALMFDQQGALAFARSNRDHAERTRQRASEMARAAADELSHILEAVAAGAPPRAERIERANESFEQAHALLARASEQVTEARRYAAVARAGLELRKEALRGALEARGQRLARASEWADRFWDSAA